jgi:hypothetical protein
MLCQKSRHTKDEMLVQWNEFFHMVGDGAAALAGLVFLAMSENVGEIIQDTTHRNRAIGTLAGFVAIFVICGLALIGGQSLRALGIEWLIVSTVTEGIYIRGVFESKKDGTPLALNFARIFTGSALHAMQIVGSIILIFNKIAGLYIAALAMVMTLAYLISGVWLLLIGVETKNK